MAYPIPTPIPTPIPVAASPFSEAPNEIDLSKSYKLTEEPSIRVKDICIYIGSLDQSFLPVDCSRCYPTNDSYAFIIDIIKKIIAIPEVKNRSNVFELLETYNKLMWNERKQNDVSDIIYSFFDYLENLDVQLVLIFSNFHLICDKVDDHEYHILHHFIVSNNVLNVWFFSNGKLFNSKNEILNEIIEHLSPLNKLQIEIIKQATYMNAHSNPINKIKLFLSYAHEDESHKETISKLLDGLIAKDLIEEWNDRHLTPGEKWDPVIKQKLYESHLVIFLVSNHFFESDYIRDVEIKNTLEKFDVDEVVIIPIVLTKCNYENSELKEITALPIDATPIDEWSEDVKGWLNAIDGIKNVINKIYKDSSTHYEKTNKIINIDQSGDHNNNTGINNGTQNIQIT